MPGECWKKVQYIRTGCFQNRQNAPSTGIFNLLKKLALTMIISRYGGSGTLQNYDAICLLPLNILNEKL